ncbi:MAG TPA: hypothetical protein VHS59_07100 [Bacillota bacterium]|nr:hypothetical protein [Bacillota bacterium]
MTAFCFYLYILFYGGSAAVKAAVAASDSAAPVSGASTQTLGSTGTGNSLATARVNTRVYTPDRELALALSNFANSKVQGLRIFSQSAADPAYNTPEKLLQYPGGAWEFSFSLDKAQNTFNYQEAMDGEVLSMTKKSGKLYYDEGKGWRKVKASQLKEEPFSFAGVRSLEKLPFLFLSSPAPVGSLVRQEQLRGKDCDVFLLKPAPPSRGSDQLSTPETPREMLLWVTSSSRPQLVAARYFWISYPPGGTMYTVNQVDFL